MAVRRMFSREICETDAFMDLPATAQRLYFFLGLAADDEGFLQNANSVTRLVGSSRDDLNILAAKRFILPFESGVIVIRHWRQHNYVPKDRFHPTRCIEEKRLLCLDSTNTYDFQSDSVCLLDTVCIQAVDNSSPEGREGERKDNNMVVAAAPPAKKLKRFIPPTIEEVRAYCEERHNAIDAQVFVDHYAASGWMRGKTPIKDWKACVRTWERNRQEVKREGDPYAGYERF